ncbi:MAG TPA: hypothetical protein VGT98_06325 [Candidatus Elarobacter sp.]|nr:hypothetical protein [Candidatus Elarobacter sp.]HEV2738170.1 hypothetical protein [Candidatus Elarobacter sp.]
MNAAQRAPMPEPRRVVYVRAATQRRVRRTRRRMRAPVFAMLTLTVIALIPLLGYVTLTARLTSLNYALVRSDHERVALLEDTQRLDERIARLQSPDRLAALAAKLKLHDPHVYAVVRVPDPKPQPRPTGFALFAWFSSK